MEITLSIKYIKEPCEEAAILSVKGLWNSLEFIKNPSELTISEILKVLEGENIFIDINEEEENELENFINKNLWKDINCLISKYFSAITLEDLVNEYKKSKDTIIYYI